MKQGFRIVDVDMHMQEPPSLYQQHLPEPYLSRTRLTRPPEGEVAQGGAHIEIDGRVVEAAPPDQPSLVLRQSLRHIPAVPNLHAANTLGTPEVWLEGMDIEGIDVAILVPQLVRHITQMDGMEPDHALALSRVYNDYAQEWTSADPRRLKFWGWVPRQDPALAAQEARRCAEELGAVGIATSQIAVNGNLLCDTVFDPLWEELSRLHVPLGFHVLGTSRHQALRDSVAARYRGHERAEIVSSTLGIGGFSAHTTLAELILGGVLERYPALTPVILEANAGWVPWLLWAMDEKWETYGSEVSYVLSMKPSEYFRRQCYVAADPHEGTIPYVIDCAGDDHLLFSVDYPHHDSLFPEGVNSFLALAGIGQSSKRKILWENAARLFQLEAA